MSKLHLKITTPERILLEEEATEIVLETKSGQITILPNHERLISEIIPGEIIIRNENEEKIAVILGGFINVKEGSCVIILADSAEHLHEINEKEAEEARKRAEGLMNEVKSDKIRFAEVEAEFVKNIARLHVIKKHRTKKI